MDVCVSQSQFLQELPVIAELVGILEWIFESSFFLWLCTGLELNCADSLPSGLKSDTMASFRLPGTIPFFFLGHIDFKKSGRQKKQMKCNICKSDPSDTWGLFEMRFQSDLYSQDVPAIQIRF